LQFGPGQYDAIDTDLLSLRINTRSQLRDGLAIDLHASFENELLAFPPAGHTRGRQHFLQPVAAWVASVVGVRGVVFALSTLRFLG
jgi:hypothetical protein